MLKDQESQHKPSSQWLLPIPRVATLPHPGLLILVLSIQGLQKHASSRSFQFQWDPTMLFCQGLNGVGQNTMYCWSFIQFCIVSLRVSHFKLQASKIANCDKAKRSFIALKVGMLLSKIPAPNFFEPSFVMPFIPSPSSSFLCWTIGPKPWSHWQGRTLSVKFSGEARRSVEKQWSLSMNVTWNHGLKMFVS